MNWKTTEFMLYLIIFMGGFIVLSYFMTFTPTMFPVLILYCALVIMFIVCFFYVFFYENSTILPQIVSLQMPITLQIITIFLGSITTFISTLIVLITLGYIRNLKKRSDIFILVSDKNYKYLQNFKTLTILKMCILLVITFVVLYDDLDIIPITQIISLEKKNILIGAYVGIASIVALFSGFELYTSVEILKTKLNNSGGDGKHKI